MLLLLGVGTKSSRIDAPLRPIIGEIRRTRIETVSHTACTMVGWTASFPNHVKQRQHRRLTVGRRGVLGPARLAPYWEIRQNFGRNAVHLFCRSKNLNVLLQITSSKSTAASIPPAIKSDQSPLCRSPTHSIAFSALFYGGQNPKTLIRIRLRQGQTIPP